MKPCSWCQHPTDINILFKNFKFCGIELCSFCMHKKNKQDRIKKGYTHESKN